MRTRVPYSSIITYHLYVVRAPALALTLTTTRCIATDDLDCAVLTHSFTYSTVGYEIHTVRLYHQQHPQSNRNDNNANAVDGTDALPCLALPSNHRIAL